MEWWLWVLLIVVVAALAFVGRFLAQSRRRRGRVVAVRDIRTGGRR